MKINSRFGFAALALAVAAAGCTKIDNLQSNGPIALTNVDAGLGVASQKVITRAIQEDDPTLTSVADRAAEGYVMLITLDGVTEEYKYVSGRFEPVNDPVYFPYADKAIVDFWLGPEDGAEDGEIELQDGTAEQLLAADVLTASQSFSAVSYLRGIVLTHVNSLIEISFAEDIDTDLLGDVYISGIPAYKSPETGRYLTIVPPGIDEIMIELTYKNISKYELVVGKEAIVGNVKEFESNNRYSLTLNIDEQNVLLLLKAVSVAKWVDTENVIATSVKTEIIIDGNDPNINSLMVKFTNGDSQIIESIDGQYEFDPDVSNARTIYSIQNMDGNNPIPGTEILIGRAEGKMISLKLDGGAVVFRDAVDGSVPIGTYAELALIGDAANLNGEYIQEADLDLLGTSVSPSEPIAWTSIGIETNPFTGIYDGGGFNIDNIIIDIGANDNAGLFGYCRSGTLRNINIASGSVKGRSNIAGVCGYLKSAANEITIIENCTNNADITGYGGNSNNIGGICGTLHSEGNIAVTRMLGCINTGNVNSESTDADLGGVCGYSYSRNAGAEVYVEDCVNKGTVTGTCHYIGGICGWNQGYGASITTKNCINEGDIRGIGNSSYAIGGIIGCNYAMGLALPTSLVTGCRNEGKVSGNGYRPIEHARIGGICGANQGITGGKAIIEYCINSIGADITGADMYVGGICGYNEVTGDNYNPYTQINYCSNHGIVTGQSDYVGGICGYSTINNSTGYATFSACANRGAISSTGMYVGGVCGGNEVGGGTITIVECYSAASVIGASNVGGVCGNNSGTITFCYWGVGNSTDSSPTVAVGGNGNAGSSYQFGVQDGQNIYWPGSYPTSIEYWILEANDGNWASLGEWGESPETSTYPVLKTQMP